MRSKPFHYMEGRQFHSPAVLTPPPTKRNNSQTSCLQYWEDLHSRSGKCEGQPNISPCLESKPISRSSSRVAGHIGSPTELPRNAKNTVICSKGSKIYISLIQSAKIYVQATKT
jgi:hypothetical protein